VPKVRAKKNTFESWSNVSFAGSFDNFLNIQIVLIIALQVAMCLLHGGLGLWWRNAHGVDRYFLALTTQGQVGFTSHDSNHTGMSRRQLSHC